MSKKSARGRPAGPPKSLYRKRLTAEEKKAVADFVRGMGVLGRNAMADRPSDPVRDEIYEKFGTPVEIRMEKMVGVVPASTSSTQEPFVAKVDPSALLLEIEVLKGQQKALLFDLEVATKATTDLQARLSRCAAATDDQKARYWMNRAVVAENKLATIYSQ